MRLAAVLRTSMREVPLAVEVLKLRTASTRVRRIHSAILTYIAACSPYEDVEPLRPLTIRCYQSESHASSISISSHVGVVGRVGSGTGGGCAFLIARSTARPINLPMG